MKIEDIELASKLKYKLDELQAVVRALDNAEKAENVLYISVLCGDRLHIPGETAEKIINIIISDIEAIKHDIEAL
ncbi:MAG: hypothetical protein K2N25_03405 [Muribaculaceae bacterium]|nr:hypothetical protein [Muribaculaceae bacterium]